MSLNEYLQQHYMPSSVKSYRADIEMYLATCPGAATAAYKDILNYVGALRERYSNKRTVSRIMSCIKAYYNYLCDEGIRKDNPASAIRLMNKRTGDVQLQDLLNREQLDNLLNRRERYKDHDHRHKVMMGLLIYQALLPSEITTLQAGDIDLVEGTVYVRGTGATNSRELPLKPNQILVLHTYLSEVRARLLRGCITDRLLIRSSGQPMTPIEIGQAVLRCYKNRYPGKRVNARIIRQSVIANLLKEGHDISVVQLFAGHKLPDATERYKPGGVDSLRAALQKYHPFKPS